MIFFKRTWWRVILAAILAFAAWPLACWWTGPVVVYPLRLSKTVAQQLLGFTPRGELIAAGVDPDDSRFASVCLWSVSALQPTVIWRSPVSSPGAGTQFTLSSNGRWLNIDLVDSRLVLDLETGKEFPHSREGKVWISPDGRLLMNDNVEPGIEVSELQTGRVVGRIDDSWIHEISPNGEWVLTSPDEGYRVWRIHDGKVTLTELTFDVLVPGKAMLQIGPNQNSAGLTHQKTLWGHFTPDSRRLCVRAIGTFGIWQLDPPELLQTKETFAVEGITTDGLWTFLFDGTRVSTLDGAEKSLFQSATDRGVQLGPLLDGNSQFLSLHQRVSKSQQPKGFSIPIGSYELSLRQRTPDSKDSYCLYDAVRGDTTILPHWMVKPRRAPIIPGFSAVRDFADDVERRAFLHPGRLALLTDNESTCWIIPLPPARPWLKQLVIWLVLTVPLCWLIMRPFRRGRDAGIFQSNPTLRVAPAAASASH